MAALLVNPRKRRSSKRKTARKTHRKSPSRSLATVTTRKVARYRRNPSVRGNIMTTVKDGAIGAAGAIAAELLLSKLPLPAQFKSGPMQTVASALASVAVGMAVSKFGKKAALGKAMAQGGVTVALHQTMRGMVAAPLGISSGVGYYDDYNDTDLGWTESVETWPSGEELDGYYEENF